MSATTQKRLKEGYSMDNTNRKETITKTVKTGIGFGSALAMVISYVNWHSVLWAMIHGVLGWVYVLYYVIRY